MILIKQSCHILAIKLSLIVASPMYEPLKQKVRISPALKYFVAKPLPSITTFNMSASSGVLDLSFRRFPMPTQCTWARLLVFMSRIPWEY